ncbi:hypothetical protein AMECASPLE_007688 [Ameca splendens]|uniref:Uncharacterized protein n=1 Tax=Ameca splendens TaxID=208324 RepID=A0ABV0XNP6_9TELE
MWPCDYAVKINISYITALTVRPLITSPARRSPAHAGLCWNEMYRVCCAVLDHCSEELSVSATRQVNVTVPPTETVSSEVTGCSSSSSRGRTSA